MPIAVKICGITSAEAMEAACTGGAAWVGLNFYAHSPRFVSDAKAGELAVQASGRARCVGVFVDAPDNVIEEVLEAAALDALQFHGSETPAQVARARDRFGLPVIRAIRLATPADLKAAKPFEEAADMLLFDAKPPPDPGMLPGGNGLSFDWRLLQGLEVERPWLLSGGLSADNLAAAVDLCAARAVDVSSGVERRPGEKDPARIARFLEVAATLGPLAARPFR